MSPSLSRIIVLLYGLMSYVVGVAGPVSIILALAKFIPFGFLNDQDTAFPVLWNLVLVLLWGLSHSIMARKSFKAWIVKIIPVAAERSTYVLVAGVASILLIGLWQTVPGVVWSVTTPVGIIFVWALCGFGWLYLLASSFAINHFDLFGLRQVYSHFLDKPLSPLKFVKTAMYRTTRHPIQTGVLIGIWVTPEMTATQIVLSIGFTVYIFVGLWFEERDLVEAIGEPYEQYKRETGKVFPKIFGRNA
jgi:protein-S-isoprenylcysteine O-methyltransferase Ste14